MKNLLKSKGFTLLEVLVSLVILSLSLLALAGLMSITTKNNAFGSNMTEAATLAQDKLEELRVLSWGDIPLNQTSSDSPFARPGVQYDRRWIAVLGPNSPAPPNDNEKRVTVTVNWNDGIARSINFLAVVTR